MNPDNQIVNLQNLLKTIPDTDTESISAIIKQIDNIRTRQQQPQTGGKKKSHGKKNKKRSNKRRKSKKKN